MSPRLLQDLAPGTQLLFALRYDGARLHGTALQPDVPTAAGLVLARVHKHLRPTRVWALSVTARLDAGVHAHFNLLSLRLSAPHLDTDGLRQALAALEADATDALTHLVVQALPYRMSARGLASGKTYRYVIEDHGAPWAGEASWPQHAVWRVAPKLDVALMQQAADVFVGEHDFTAFAASPKRRNQSRAQARRQVRRMRILALPKGAPPGPPRICIECEAVGLLRRQMRFMVAAIVCAGARLTTPQRLARQLHEALPPLPRAPQAPACGLYLMDLTCDGPSAAVVSALKARLDAAAHAPCIALEPQGAPPDALG